MVQLINGEKCPAEMYEYQTQHTHAMQCEECNSVHVTSTQVLQQPEASIPSETMTHFPAVSDFPHPYFRKIFRLGGKF